MCESTTASPGPRLAPPQERASRLNPSVKFLVKMISSLYPAPMKRATLAREASMRAVACWAIW